MKIEYIVGSTELIDKRAITKSESAVNVYNDFIELSKHHPATLRIRKQGNTFFPIGFLGYNGGIYGVVIKKNSYEHVMHKLFTKQQFISELKNRFD